MSRVKEVVDWIVENNMYCILNTYHDGGINNWLYKGLVVINKYINLWTQIANEFEDYGEYLIFESMNEPAFSYSELFNMTQAFIDTIRNSKGKNKERLLLISAPYAHLDYTIFSEFKLPKDPYDKLAVSIHYFIPELFTAYPYIEGYYDREKWGSDSDYNELMTNFELMKSHFVDKGIPIIIGETGVITEGDKDIQSVREYLYALFSLSVEYNGIMACVWDTSNQTSYGINYYNRENDKWYDEKIKNNFIEISKGNFFKSSEFYIKTNIETSTEENFNKNYLIKLRMRKALKIFVNATFYGKLFKDFNIHIYSINKNNEYFEIYFNKNDLKKQYGGTTIIFLDVSNKDCNEQIEVHIPFGRKYLSFNGLSIEFKENFISFDYKAYKSSILNNIS